MDTQQDYQDNPCERCTIDQDCCTHLTGLRLTEAEYKRCFEHHAANITVERDGQLYVVSQKTGGACPNWQGGGCSVYEDRPRECALFPHTMYYKASNDGYDVIVHDDVHCPLKQQLRYSGDKAKSIAKELAVEAFGESAAISVALESKAQRIVRRLHNSAYKLRAAISSK